MTKVKIDGRMNEKLRVDPISDTEKFFNKHYSEFNKEENLMMLANAFRINTQKADYLKGLGDTHFGMSWDKFISIIESYGFKVGYKYDFEHDNGEYADEAALYYHPEKGLVIWATSYFNKSSVNGGKLYGQLKTNEKIEFETVKNEAWGTEYKQMKMTDSLKKSFEPLNNCSHGAFMNIETGIEFSLDVREGLINKLEAIGNGGLEFVKEWNNKSFLWFLDFEEEKGNYDREEITNEKISKCPEELQQILKVCTD